MSSVCTHLLGAKTGSTPLRERLVLDDYSGMTVGVVSCRTCEATYALELLDWDARLERRIFRVATLPRHVVEEYEAKGGRATCKLELGRLELEALLALRSETRALVALRIAEYEWLGLAEADGEVPTGAWGEVLPDAADPGWFAALGLTKER